MIPRWRVTGFVVAGVLLAILLGWAARTTWHRLHQLRDSYAAVESDTFHLSASIEASVRDLHETLLRFDSRKNPSDRARFLTRSKELNQWITDHKTAVTTAAGHRLLERIQTAVESY